MSLESPFLKSPYVETLQNEVWKLLIAPEVGASIAGLYAFLDTAWQPILRETPAEAMQKGNPSDFGSFILAPFSNRLKEARFEFLGQTYQLKANTDGNTQHGDVRGRPWQLLAKSEFAVEFGLTSKTFADFNFPFDFEMKLNYSLQGDLFITHMSLKNTGDKHMPAGFGIHPYFKQTLGNSQKVRLAFQAEGLYLLDEQFIPTGSVDKPHKAYDFSHAKVPEIALNNLYRDSSELFLEWLRPSGERLAKLDIYADAIFKHLIVFTHPDGSLAVEPVSNANDGFNLMAKGFEGHGVKVLAPQESIEGSVFFKLSV